MRAVSLAVEPKAPTKLSMLIIAGHTVGTIRVTTNRAGSRRVTGKPRRALRMPQVTGQYLHLLAGGARAELKRIGREVAQQVRAKYEQKLAGKTAGAELRKDDPTDPAKAADEIIGSISIDWSSLVDLFTPYLSDTFSAAAAQAFNDATSRNADASESALELQLLRGEGTPLEQSEIIQSDVTPATPETQDQKERRQRLQEEEKKLAEQAQEQAGGDQQPDQQSGTGASTEGLVAGGGAIAAARGGSTVSAQPSSPFDQINQRAAAYAAERGAELVGMRRTHDGQLVQNPNAQWAISDQTRAHLRDLVEQAFVDGASPADLSDMIESDASFAESRADMIARTELAFAQTAGALDGWDTSGQVEGKQWILASSHPEEDECDDNADDGAIALDDTFSTGDDGPPAHPNCECDVIAVLIDDGSGDSSGDNTGDNSQ